MTKYFGTDGVRGEVGKYPMTVEFAYKLGIAAGTFFKKKSADGVKKVVLVRDTRISGSMLEASISAGLAYAGFDVCSLGIIQTPACAYGVRKKGAAFGVVISASHNPYTDNGIKFFNALGQKLNENEEEEIEGILEAVDKVPMADLDQIGVISKINWSEEYINYLKDSMKGADLSGLKIVLDTANGAACETAPQVFRDLGAQLTVIGDVPNGININDGYGATDVSNLGKKVVKEGADFGIALDGDADRIIMVDEQGKALDGDQLLAFLAKYYKKTGILKNNAAVATVESNLIGLKRYFDKEGIDLEVVGVGDRYVARRIREKDLSLGAEQTGHMVLANYSTTGDGALAGLEIAKAFKALSNGDLASSVFNVFAPVPQVLKSVKTRDHEHSINILEDDEIKAKEGKINAELEKKGARMLFRRSGTSPKIKVMIEGDDKSYVEDKVDEMIKTVEEVAGRY